MSEQQLSTVLYDARGVLPPVSEQQLSTVLYDARAALPLMSEQQLKAGLLEEAGRVTLVQTLGEKVIPNTSAQGQQNVRAQLESTEQEWQAISSTAE